MSRIAFGNQDGSSLILQKGYPIATREGKQWVLEARYRCAQGDVLGLVPEAYAACPFEGFTDLILGTAGISASDMPGIVDVLLKYRPVNPSGGYGSRHQTSEAQRAAQASWQEVPIDDDRLVSSGLYNQPDIDAMKAKGYSTIGIGSVEYTYTEWDDAFEWSEAALTGGIGETGAPTGISSATAANWLLVGRTVRLDGDLTEKARTWRYNRLGWTP